VVEGQHHKKAQCLSVQRSTGALPQCDLLRVKLHLPDVSSPDPTCMVLICKRNSLSCRLVKRQRISVL